MDVLTLRPLSGLQDLKRLDLTFCEKVEDLKPLSSFISLQRLSLKGCLKVTAEKAAADKATAEKAAADKVASEKAAAAKQDAVKKEAAEKAVAEAAWQNYAARKKTVLEQVMNYTVKADVEGDRNYYWVSGANGKNKCVMSSVLLKGADKGLRGFAAFIGLVPLSIDIRNFSKTGFRISSDWVGDENFKLPRSKSAVDERLQNAWRLAFSECPSNEKAPF